jgi:hypothetical protein
VPRNNKNSKFEFQLTISSKGSLIYETGGKSGVYQHRTCIVNRK